LEFLLVVRTMIFKPCANCYNTLYEIRDGYTICLKCGYICSSRTYEDFNSIGFVTDNKSLEKTIKHLRKTRPNLDEKELLNRLNMLFDKSEKELKKALAKY